MYGGCRDVSTRVHMHVVMGVDATIVAVVLFVSCRHVFPLTTPTLPPSCYLGRLVSWLFGCCDPSVHATRLAAGVPTHFYVIVCRGVSSHPQGRIRRCLSSMASSATR